MRGHRDLRKGREGISSTWGGGRRPMNGECGMPASPLAPVAALAGPAPRHLPSTEKKSAAPELFSAGSRPVKAGGQREFYRVAPPRSERSRSHPASEGPLRAAAPLAAASRWPGSPLQTSPAEGGCQARRADRSPPAPGTRSAGVPACRAGGALLTALSRDCLCVGKSPAKVQPGSR